MKHALSALIIVFFVSACGGVGSGAPQHGLLGAYASAYEAELRPKIKPQLESLERKFNSRDFDDATSELDTFNKKFFGTVKNVFPFRDEPCVYIMTSGETSSSADYSCWQVVGDYAVLIQGVGANIDVFKDSASGKKFYTGDTIRLTTTEGFSEYNTCIFTDKSNSYNPYVENSSEEDTRNVNACISSRADSHSDRDPLKSKLSKVKVVITVFVPFSTATLACLEKDCLDEELAKK